ncbi:MAG: RES family NAD+ phosphorylase [Cyanobacteria bacterium J06635_13]
MVLLYRIRKAKRIDDLSGEGARLYGGRWNIKGTPVLYTSDSTALATLETLVHTPLNLMPKNLSIVTLELADNLDLLKINREELPKKWWIDPAPLELAQIGQAWVKKQSSVALVVPSSVTPTGEGRNYILNPRHPDFTKVKIVKVSAYNYDERLFC